jgi:phage FluMu protein Com
MRQEGVQTERRLAEYRCQCGKLLFKAMPVINVLEIKCRGCGRIIRFGRADEPA